MLSSLLLLRSSSRLFPPEVGVRNRSDMLIEKFRDLLSDLQRCSISKVQAEEPLAKHSRLKASWLRDDERLSLGAFLYGEYALHRSIHSSTSLKCGRDSNMHAP